MPLYTFHNEKNGIYEDVFFHMNDKKVFNGKDGTEVGEWRRVFTKPYAAISTDIDPFSARAFADKTGNSKGSIGDLWERSQELSAIRADKRGGQDPVKIKALEEYSKSRNGARHPSENVGKIIDTKHAKIEVDKKPIEFAFE